MPMPFSYHKTVHFADTDAAGLVFFANFYAFAHEAYEEAIAAVGINMTTYFSDTGSIIPIAKSEAEYLRPLKCGDKLRITVTPKLISENSFELHTEIVRLGPPDKLAARVLTEHVCISSTGRGRVPLSPAMAAWITT